MDEAPKKSIWKKDLKEIWFDFKQYAKTPKGKKTLIITGVFLVVIAVFSYALYEQYFKIEAENKAEIEIYPKLSDETEKKEQKVVSLLDGVEYTEATANRHPLGIMIENHPDARPQSGLSRAKVIYEAVTEGGITRYMAVFGPESDSKVGPVRSARTYYLDWCLEYDCFYSHVGGNLDALELIPTLGIKDLDQFKYGSQAYWRIPQAGKATEHTMYTDTDKLWQIAEENGWDMKSDFDSLPFKTDPAKDMRPEAKRFKINFSTETYNVSWEYNNEDNTFLRTLAGKEDKDAETGERLKAKNIIIQETDRWYSPTSINEEGWAMKTVGQGKAKIAIDGKLIEATWEKDSHTARTLYYDLDGKKIEFNPGVFWYEIVPPGTAVIEY